MPKKKGRKAGGLHVIAVLNEQDKFRDVGLCLVRATPRELKKIVRELDGLRDGAGEMFDVQDVRECSAKAYLKDLVDYRESLEVDGLIEPEEGADGEDR